MQFSGSVPPLHHTPPSFASTPPHPHSSRGLFLLFCSHTLSLAPLSIRLYHFSPPPPPSSSLSTVQQIPSGSQNWIEPLWPSVFPPKKYMLRVSLKHKFKWGRNEAEFGVFSIIGVWRFRGCSLRCFASLWRGLCATR